MKHEYKKRENMKRIIYRLSIIIITFIAFSLFFPNQKNNLRKKIIYLMQTKEERNLGKNKPLNNLTKNGSTVEKINPKTPTTQKKATANERILMDQTRIFADKATEIIKKLSSINSTGIDDKSKKLTNDFEKLIKKIQRVPKNVPERVIKKVNEDLAKIISLKESAVNRKHEKMYAEKFPKTEEITADQDALVEARKLQELLLNDLDVFSKHFYNESQKKIN